MDINVYEADNGYPDGLLKYGIWIYTHEEYILRMQSTPQLLQCSVGI